MDAYKYKEISQDLFDKYLGIDLIVYRLSTSLVSFHLCAITKYQISNFFQCFKFNLDNSCFSYDRITVFTDNFTFYIMFVCFYENVDMFIQQICQDDEYIGCNYMHLLADVASLI